MGKAQIVSGGTKGRYQIKIDYGKDERDRRIASIDKKIGEIQVQNDAKKEIIDEHLAKIAAINAEINTAIEVFNNSPSESTKKTVENKTYDLIAEQKAHDQLNTLIEQGKADIAALKKTKTALYEIAVEEIVTAWCADYTESGSGQVATIEVPGEPLITLVAPQCRPPESTDGDILKREFMTPEQAYFNAAILPGWQKFKPTYRRGTITGINYDTNRATVVLAQDKSSAQELGINQAPVLTNVPVVYMTCNASAFEDGDQVVVSFDSQDWANPRIIGFVTAPKPCVEFPLYIYLRIYGEISESARGPARPWFTSVVTDPCGERYSGFTTGTTQPIVTESIMLGAWEGDPEAEPGSPLYGLTVLGADEPVELWGYESNWNGDVTPSPVSGDTYRRYDIYISTNAYDPSDERYGLRIDVSLSSGAIITRELPGVFYGGGACEPGALETGSHVVFPSTVESVLDFDEIADWVESINKVPNISATKEGVIRQYEMYGSDPHLRSLRFRLKPR